MTHCVPDESARAGPLETVLERLAGTAGHDTTNKRVYAELSITGLARFLSHAELLKGLERSCVRAGIDLRYSQGFNPRPIMSLPLPKSVGVESTGDVLCLSLGDSGQPSGQAWTSEAVRVRLCEHLPEGITLLALSIAICRVSLQPDSAQWTIPVDLTGRSEAIQEVVDRLLASDSIPIERAQPAKSNKTKRKDIRQYLSSIETTPECIRVAYRITPQGSVRLDEVLGLLGLTPGDLTGPIQRTHIRWRFV